MAVYPIPAWEPDRGRLDPSASATIKNVIPVQDGYGPMNGIDPFSDALSSACRGAMLAIDDDDTIHVIAGTATGLFKLSNQSWVDVSRTAGGAYNLADGHFWSLAQHNNNIVGVHLNDDPQKYELGVDTDFSALSGSPPRARYATTESGYLTFGHLSGSERTVRRSGYKDITHWTVGHKGADQETLSEGGLVAGFASDSTGTWIFQDRRVRRLQNNPGNEVSFSLIDMDPTRGAVAPHSIVQWGAASVEFLAEDGFYRLGSPSSPIGAERIDKTFLDDIDLARLYEVQGVADPVRKMNWWRYSSEANAGNAYTDKLIGHHWHLDRWVYAEIKLEWLCTAALPAFTLEEMETVLGYATLEAIPYSLDSRVWKSGRPALAAFDSDHKLGFFEGDYLEGLLDSADIPIGGEGLRGYVSGFRPVGDVSGAFGSCFTKETYQGTGTQGTESQQNSTGLIPIRASGRTVRFRTRIPSSAWGSHPVISGIEIPQESMRVAGRR